MKNTQTLRPDEFFTQEIKEIFLKIPHEVVNIHPKLEIIDFNVAGNGDYRILRNMKMARLLEPLTSEEKRDFNIRQHLFDSFYGYGDEQPGLYINSKHGSVVEDFIKALYPYDLENATKLQTAYQEFATTCDDILSIEEKMVRHLAQLKAHLLAKNYCVENYAIDYIAQEQKSEDEQNTAVEELYAKFGNGYDFPAYNDLDYTPYTVGNDMYIYDSSGARLYVVKEEGESTKIYMLNRDDFDMEMDDAMNDFAGSHRQRDILLAKSINMSHLIGEVKDCRIVRASQKLTVFDMIQGFILNSLYQEGQIKNAVPLLSFEELLDNYTLQKEFYHLKERALIKIFSDIQLVDGILTYEDYSAMGKNYTKAGLVIDYEIKHEDFSVHAANDIKDNFQQSEYLKMSQIPQKYKEQIDAYLTKLNATYDHETTHAVVDFLRSEMDSPSKKAKMRR